MGRVNEFPAAECFISTVVLSCVRPGRFLCVSDKVGYQCGFTNVALSLKGLLGPVAEVLKLFVCDLIFCCLVTHGFMV